jgi:hypothetical protein
LHRLFCTGSEGRGQQTGQGRNTPAVGVAGIHVTDIKINPTHFLMDLS